MRRASNRNWSLVIFAMVILGVAYWWWQDRDRIDKGSASNSPKALINTTASEAKEEAAKMTMEIASTAITDIEGGRIRSLSRVVLKNPLPVKLTASRLDYVMLINSIKVAQGSYTQPIEIPASGSKTISLPISIMVKPMDAVIDQMDNAKKDTAAYTFLNTLYTDVPIAGKRQIPFNIKEELPIVRLPKMRIGNIDINDMGLKHSGMKITMQVTNRNSFPIRLEDGKYSMSIDGKNTMSGSMQDIVILPAKKTVPVTLQVDMKTGGALKMGWKMLKEKTNSSYKLTFDGRISSESKMLKNSSMQVDEEGNLSDLKKEVKKAME